MKITPKQLGFLFRVVEEYLNNSLVLSWVKKHVNSRAIDVKFTDNGFEFEYNDSCHCHPEYVHEHLSPEQSEQLLAHLAELNPPEPTSPEEEITFRCSEEQ